MNPESTFFAAMPIYDRGIFSMLTAALLPSAEFIPLYMLNFTARFFRFLIKVFRDWTILIAT
jgi:hypothetical protein